MKLSFVGDSGIDVYLNTSESRLGGCALNLGVHSKKLWKHKAQVSVWGPLGTDSHKDAILALCKKEHLESKHDILEGATARCPIQLGPNGSRKFMNYEAGVLKNYRLNDLQKRELQNEDWAHTVVYPSTHPLALGMIEGGQKPARGFSVDFSDLKEFDEDPKIMEPFLPHADLILLGLESKDSTLFQYAKVQTLKRNLPFLVTFGEKGSTFLQGQYEENASIEPVANAVDTTGAGDSFLAAFLFGYLQKHSIDQCLRAAAYFAAKTVTKLGAF